MKSFLNYRSTTGILTILSGILAAACMYVGTLAVAGNFEAFSSPILALDYSKNAALFADFMLLDMLGYYILLIPVICYLHRSFKEQSAWVPMFSLSGVAYVLIGSIGAGILAATWPELMKNYLDPSHHNKEILVAVFSTTTLMVTKGLWNILEMIFAATWWIGVGSLLIKKSKIIGLLTLATGAACLVNALGNVAGIELLAAAALNIYLLLAIVWPVVIGIALTRKSINNENI